MSARYATMTPGAASQWHADMRRDSQLAQAIKALADVVPGTSGHARLTLEDALATLQEERAMIVRRWD